MDNPETMFLSRNKFINVYPSKPQFYFIKVGFKWVKIILAWFRDVEPEDVDTATWPTQY